jgi:hypothetical protein
VLISPEDGAQLAKTDSYADLRWRWDGVLEEEEYFDVRFWKEGAPHHGVAWAKEGFYPVKGEPGMTYYWAIAVIRGQGGQMLEQLSPESKARRLFWPTPADTTPPPAPSPFTPQDGATLTCRSSQTLTWEPVSDPSGISGYYGKLEEEVTPGSWQPGGWGPVGDNQVDVSVRCGFNYRWRVWAKDGAGNLSDWSEWSYFYVVLPPPSPSTPDDGATLTCRSSQTLTWEPASDPSDISAYYGKLEREVSPGNWQPGGWGPVSDNQVDVPVQCGSYYRWRVRAQSSAGNWSDWSQWSYFLVEE